MKLAFWVGKSGGKVFFVGRFPFGGFPMEPGYQLGGSLIKGIFPVAPGCT